MNARRAQEISSSPVMANVTYQGQQIYIEHVDQTQGVATIHSVNNPHEKQCVPVDQLIEHQ